MNKNSFYGNPSGGALIDDEAAKALLDVMVHDSAFEFSKGVKRYIEAEKRAKKARAELMKFVDGNEELEPIFINYEYANKMKRDAVRAIKNEFLFLNGSRDVRPPIDGMYVMVELIKDVLSKLDEESYEEALNLITLSRAKKKKR